MNKVLFENNEYAIYKINRKKILFRIGTNTYLPIDNKFYSILTGIKINGHEKEIENRKYILKKFFSTSSYHIPNNPIGLQQCEYTLKLIHTSRCNLRCNYCFAKDKSKNNDMSYETAVRAIDFFLDSFASKEAKKYVIDLTGSGEPLLNLDFILKVNDYVQNKRRELGINIFCQLASNGMLLSKEVSYILKKNNILFGVSLDGTKKMSEKVRKGLDYEKVIKNISEIENKDFFGLACTYSSKNFDFLKIFKTLDKLNSEVIGMKPVRLPSYYLDSINKNNLSRIKKSYLTFAKWLLKNIEKGSLSEFYKLMKGDDYFARFLKITLHPSHLYYRCSAGVNSLAIDAEGNMLICPAFVGKKETYFGNIFNNYDSMKLDFLKNSYADNISSCKKCWARYACGGECFNLSYEEFNQLNKPVNSMCELKKFLIQLSSYFWIYLHINFSEIFDKIKREF